MRTDRRELARQLLGDAKVPSGGGGAGGDGDGARGGRGDAVDAAKGRATRTPRLAAPGPHVQSLMLPLQVTAIALPPPPPAAPTRRAQLGARAAPRLQPSKVPACAPAGPGTRRVP